MTTTSAPASPISISTLDTAMRKGKGGKDARGVDLRDEPDLGDHRASLVEDVSQPFQTEQCSGVTLDPLRSSLSH